MYGVTLCSMHLRWVEGCDILYSKERLDGCSSFSCSVVCQRSINQSINPEFLKWLK